jgi:hypothetical protein
LPSIATNQQPSDCVGVVHSSLTQQQKNQLPPTTRKSRRNLKKKTGLFVGMGWVGFWLYFSVWAAYTNYYYIH